LTAAAPQVSSPRAGAERCALPYVLPFATLIALLALAPHLHLPPAWNYPLRTAAVLAALLAVSRGVIVLRPSRPGWSVVVGLAVFAIWVGPDLLFPGYHQHWLFGNVLTASPAASVIPEALRTSALWVSIRAGGSVLLIPVVEELFWRAWLMRRLISPAIETVPLGAYSGRAFWLTAVLFASEHGAFWGVGLAAGILYNWWMVRTRSLADCILAHAVTNGALALYVLAGGHWEYWL
jgi:CAAX prenyl protease-like protein